MNKCVGVLWEGSLASFYFSLLTQHRAASCSWHQLCSCLVLTPTTRTLWSVLQVASSPLNDVILSNGSNVYVESISASTWPYLATAKGSSGSDYVEVVMSVCASPTFSEVRGGNAERAWGAIISRGGQGRAKRPSGGIASRGKRGQAAGPLEQSIISVIGLLVPVVDTCLI